MDPVEEIKQRLDIVDVVSETVNLRRSGKNYVGFCPFHPNTRTPAFVVFPDTGTWRCFGQCNEGGDIFTFVMKREGWDFPEALRYLAQKAGVPLEPRSPERARQEEAHERLRELLEEAVTFYRAHLRSPAGEAALAYLRRRGLHDNTIEAWGLGYAPDAWDAAYSFFRQRGYTEEELLTAGLLSKNEEGRIYDRFRHRIMFPIRDERGRIAGFGARTLDPEGVPKYLNTPQTPLFDKGRLLYGLDKARKAIREQDQVVMVEGYMDVIALHQAGYTNVVSPMGTALTEAQLRLVKRYTRNIVLALDPDAAGQKAVLRSLEVAREALRETTTTFNPRGLLRQEARLQATLRVVSLPEDLDPDELVMQDPTAWERLLEAAQPIVFFVMETLLTGQDLNDPKVKASLAEQLVLLIQDVPNPVERSAYLTALARRLEVSERDLLSLAARQRPQRRVRKSPRSPAQAPEQVRRTAGVPAGASLTQMERVVLGLLLREPELLFRMDRLLRAAELSPTSPQDFEEVLHRKLFEKVHEALEQHEMDPADYLHRTLPEEWLIPVQRLLEQTVELAQATPRQRLEEAVRQILLLRRQRIQRTQEHLRFVIEEAQRQGAEDWRAYLQQSAQAAMVLQRVDRALAELPRQVV